MEIDEGEEDVRERGAGFERSRVFAKSLEGERGINLGRNHIGKRIQAYHTMVATTAPTKKKSRIIINAASLMISSGDNE